MCKNDILQKQAVFFDQINTSDAILRLFVRHKDVHFFVKSAQHEFIAANQHFIESKGFLHEWEIIGKTSFDISPPELARMYHEDDVQVMQSGEDLVDRVEVIVSATGETSWLVTTKIPLYDRDEKVAGVAVYARDLKKAAGSLRTYSLFDDVINYIHNNYHTNLPVSILAEKSHMSSRTFERKFKKTFGTTPIQYIIRYRINKACEFLRESNWGFAELAQTVGFYDQSAFTKAFIKIVGIRPKEYRKKINYLNM